MHPSFIDKLPRPAEPAGLYIHVPFCVRKCAYCDFYSVTDRSLEKAYLNALVREMGLFTGLALSFDTVYIGGGTPSVLNPAEIAQILTGAYRYFDIMPEAEVTLEVNPGTVTPGSLSAYRQSGINRLNIGVQSFQEPVLVFLQRIHTGADAANCMRWARTAGFIDIGMDLIYGLPEQTEALWLADLERAVAFGPEHLSCYMLSYEKGTPLTRSLQRGIFKAQPEERVAALFLRTVEWLAENGYVQYEISNFTKAGPGGAGLFASRHNRKYWSFAPYLGLGPSAHSFLEPVRFWNRRSVRHYVEKLKAGKAATAGKEALTRQQRIIESVFLGLRTAEGIRVDLFEKRFGLDFLDLFGAVVSQFKEKGLLQAEKDRCFLTCRGMLFLDSIAAAMIEAVPVPAGGRHGHLNSSR